MQKIYKKTLNDELRSDNREDMANPINSPTSSKKDESLTVNALTDKNFRAYERLLLQGYSPVSGEVRSKILQNFTEQEKGKIRDIHLNCSIKNYLSIVKAKCELDHAEQLENRDEFFGLIYEAINKMDKCKEFKLIMQIVELSETLQIVFDLNRNSVEYVDPTTDEYTEGICYYNSGKIIIGAKGLQDKSPNQMRRVMGVIIHEFCHLALQLLYGNKSNPYTLHDVRNKKKFKKLLKKCEAKQTVEKLVGLVFKYPKEAWHAELIVRVVHMMAFYSDDQAKLEELKGVYPQLFRYFEYKTMVDLQDESNINIVEKRLKLERVNQTCELLGKLQRYIDPFVPESLENMFPPQLSSQCTILTSNWVEGTLKGIFIKFEQQKELEGKLFMDLKHFKDSQKADKAFDVMKRYDVTVVVKCETANEKQIQESIEQIINNNSETKMIFVTANDVKFETLKPHKVENPWNQLTKKYKNWFLTKKASFQGLEVALSQILNKNSMAANKLNLNDLFNGKIMEIGEKIEKVKIHIERKFKRLNAKNDHEVFSFAELLLEMTGKQVFLLAADAGCGKSTELKVISSELTKKFPSSWVVYIDLKKYTEAFKKDREVSMTFNSSEIAKYFTESILMLKGFHKKMFVELFEENRVIFLFDGVDEISPSFKKCVLELMAAITTETQNQIWIATRKHMVEDLEKKDLTTNAYTLVEFSEDDRERFFDKALTLTDCSDDEKKEILDKVRGFLKNVEIVNLKHSNRMIANVQLLTMIVSLYKKKNFKPSGSNLFSIYSDFVKDFTKNLTSRGRDAEKDYYSFTQSSSVRKYRQKKAFEIIFLANTNILELVSEIFKDVEKPSNEKTTRTGIMNKDGTENLYFIHRTFIEFFVAEYFYEMLVGKKERENAAKVVKLFVEAMEDGDQQMMRRFLNEKLENFEENKLTVSKVLTEAIKNECSEIDSLLMLHLIIEGCVNIIKFIYLLFHDREELLDLWRQQQVLNCSSMFVPFDFTFKMWSLAESLFNADQIRILLVTEDILGMNILNFYINISSEEVFAFFVEKGRELLVKSTVEYENFFTPKKHLWNFQEERLLKTLRRSQKYLEKDEFSRLVESYENDNNFLEQTPEEQERMRCIINKLLDS